MDHVSTLLSAARPSRVSSRWWAAAAVLLLAACGDHPVAVEPVRAVRTITVGAAADATRRDYAAEIHARVESPLAFRVAGKITGRSVNLGDRVRAGQALAAVDPSDLRLGRDSAHAALVAAQVNYDQTATDYKRYQDLQAQGFISAAELERRNSGLQAAKAQLEQARAQEGLQANQTAYATLTADAPGVITAVLADVGGVVAPGTPVLSLAHDGPRDAVFAIPEDQLPVFRALLNRPGAVQVTLWGATAPIAATVREVTAAADPATRTFQVKAALPDGAAELGQTATARVQIAPADGHLRLPLQALMGQDRQSLVWLVDRPTMTVHQQAVDVLRAEGDDLVVGSGLHPGDIVVTAGAHVLTPGQKVAFYVEPAKR